jgi:hypothetical protein
MVAKIFPSSSAKHVQVRAAAVKRMVRALWG